MGKPHIGAELHDLDVKLLERVLLVVVLSRLDAAFQHCVHAVFDVGDEGELLTFRKLSEDGIGVFHHIHNLL